MSLTRARLAADAGTKYLLGLSAGTATLLYNAALDLQYWAQLEQLPEGKLELKAWAAKGDDEEQDFAYPSEFGTVCNVFELEDGGYERIDLTHKD